VNLGDKIAASKANHERRPQDYYATPPDVTQALLDYLKLDKMKVREPCCGTGEMAEVLKAYGHTVSASDIEDRGYGDRFFDYTTLPEVDPSYYDFEAVITNPPFSCAEQIIRRALRDAPIVAMLLPSGYWHSSRRAKLFKLRRPLVILNLTWRPVFVEERGTSPLMNVMWTVWMDNSDITLKVTYFDLLQRPERPIRITTPISRLAAAVHRNCNARNGID